MEVRRRTDEATPLVGTWFRFCPEGRSPQPPADRMSSWPGTTRSGPGRVPPRGLPACVLAALLLMSVASAGEPLGRSPRCASQAVSSLLHAWGIRCSRGSDHSTSGDALPSSPRSGGGMQLEGGGVASSAERGTGAGADPQRGGSPSAPPGVQEVRARGRALAEQDQEGLPPAPAAPQRSDPDREALATTDPEFIPGSLLRAKRIDEAHVRQRMTCLAQDGRWLYEPQPRPLPWNVEYTELCDKKWVALGGGRMSGPSADAMTAPDSWRVRESLKYRWEPRGTCGRWMAFDRRWFCAALRHLQGNLLVVGDSLSRYFFNSLHNNLQMWDRKQRLAKSTPPQCKLWEDMGLMPRSLKLCRSLSPCWGDRHVYLMRNDWLTTNITAPHNVSDSYFLPWLPFIAAAGVRAVLLNRGAHFVESPLFEQQLEATMQRLRKEYPGLLVIYRGSAAGHNGCDSYSVPVDEPQKGVKPYHQGQFPAQNALAKEIVERHRGLYLDVDYMSAFRPDGHFGTHDGITDCLHYCNPGPVDDWVRLFFNAWIELL